MMRSLYSGVSGLQNHEIRMDVIGNNISNVNTIGFKKGRVTFQDIFSQYLDSPSRPNEIRGGVNPKQIGLGMSVASIDTIFNAGSLQTTGVKSDIAIAGNGFFVLRDGTHELYTRAGAFDVDSEGMLVNPANGMRVQGWNAQIVNGNSVVNATGTVADIRIPIQGKDAAHATTEVRLRSNLDKNTPLIPPGATDNEVAEGTWVVEQKIFDAFGNTHILQMNFTRNVDIPNIPNQWVVEMNVDPAVEGGVAPTLAVNGTALTDNTFIVNFDNNGLLQSINDINGVLDNADNLQVDLTFEVPDTNPVPDEGGVAGPQIQTIALNLGNTGSYTDSITQFASASSTKSYFQDGYDMGYLTDFTIDQFGNIVGSFTNQQRRVLGKIAIASFTNPEGLSKVGDTNFGVTTNSGFANIGEAATVDRGTILAGKLEMSNVSLAEEFTDMIVTQRGFQANSRTIRTSDQMIQELLTLKQ